MSTQFFKSAIANIAQISSAHGFSRSDGKNSVQTEKRIHACDEKTVTNNSDRKLTSEVILENLPSCISSLDTNGIWKNVTRGNSQCLASIDCQNFNQWVSESVHVQDRVAILKAVDDCRVKHHNTTAEFRMLDNASRNHAFTWIELTCTHVDDNGTILTSLVDVTRRKLLESRILEAQELSEAANEEKSKFLANMSHELRTPLNAIIGFSEILKCGMVPASDVEKQHEYHSLINDSAMHLLNVLNDILDMSKIEAGKYEIYPEKVDLNQIISSCISMLSPLADKAGIRLCFINTDDTLSLEADSRAIRQILINLISNAIKFSNTDDQVVISAKRKGSKIECQVSDQGQGISAENLQHLGEPFQQIDGRKNRKHEGTGLGLSIVKGLISLHQGKFGIVSELGVGTTVSVEIPLSVVTSAPVPFEDADTIIRIRPVAREHEQLKLPMSRRAG